MGLKQSRNTCEKPFYQEVYPFSIIGINNLVNKYINHKSRYIELYQDEISTESIFKEFSEYAYNILSKYYKIHNKIRSFEIWSYYLNDKEIESPLAIHTDNDNGCNVHTIILYTHKDSTIVDGNLTIYDKFKSYIFWDNKNAAPKTVIDTKANTIVCLAGDTYHRPNKMQGTGSRNCIVIQFNAAD